MSGAEAVLMGIVQGLTEFFPVSSSAQMILVQALFGFTGLPAALEPLLNLSSAALVLAFYAPELADILRHQKQLILGVLLANVFTAAIAFPGQDIPFPISVAALISGALLIGQGSINPPARPASALRWGEWIALGVVQGVCVLPGITRLGMTTVFLRARGLEFRDAIRISFLTGVPALAGHSMLNLLKSSDGIAASKVWLSAAVAVGLGLIVLWLMNRHAGKKTFATAGCVLILTAIVSIMVEP